MANTLTLTDQVAIQRYHQRRQQHQYQQVRKARSSNQAVSVPQCDQTSSRSAVDIVILVIVLGACGFLFTPYFTYVCKEVVNVLPAALLLIGDVVYQAPVVYAGATFFTFFMYLVYEIYQYKARRCENPQCRGLRKAMELDIQLETEQCVKSSPPVATELPWNGGVGLGQEKKELEAELRRMAPPNGRAMLIFRRPCGCPAARIEASGTKKTLRRLKK